MIDRDAKPFVYFAEMGDGLIKIGTSASVGRRISALKARLLHAIEGSSFRECAVHFLMSAYQAHGEYFHDTDEVRGFVASLQAGDFRGLIDDLPRAQATNGYTPWGSKSTKPARCVRTVRIALGLRDEQVAIDTGMSEATIRSADGLTAPVKVSGRLVQYLVNKAAERGVWLNSHHFTGAYDSDLRERLSALREDTEEAA